jgi:hypothetical protein
MIHGPEGKGHGRCAIDWSSGCKLHFSARAVADFGGASAKIDNHEGHEVDEGNRDSFANLRDLVVYGFCLHPQARPFCEFSNIANPQA